MKLRSIFLGLTAAFLIFSCAKEKGCTDANALNYNPDAEEDNGTCTYANTPAYTIPTTYEFTDADGNNTVSYSGQTDRIGMLLEMKSYMATAASGVGTAVSAQTLLDMFANENSPFTDANLNASSKQIESKTFSLDVSAFKVYFDSIALYSQSQVAGANGTAGVVSNGTKSYLCSPTGKDYAQFVEKGLMGALLYYQIAEVYTRDGKIGEAVDNTTAVDAAAGKYYTSMQHHWDEAFGYFGAPVDFPANTNDVLFLAKYSNNYDDELGLNQQIMDAFLAGRAAINNNDTEAKEMNAAKVRMLVEKIFAGAAIHYFNVAVDNITDNTLRNHYISEGLAFLMSLKYNSDAIISQSQIDAIVSTIGDNYYDVTIANLVSARDQVSTIYSMDDVKTEL